MSTKITVNEAPSYQQVQRLTDALDKMFGVDVEIGQAGSTLYFRKTLDAGGEEYWSAAPVSGAVRKLGPNRPGGYNPLMNGANTIAAMLLQNAEMAPGMINPIINTLSRLAGTEAPGNDFATSDVSSTLDNQHELAQLRQENAKLKARIAQLEAKIDSMSGGRVLSAKPGYEDLEID